ncbi:MAG TPA: hypothetical protein VGP33_10980, partial [Chloroflexota bacterium]|nr:hypothetical protein [Chloroflexota bacterium]
MGQYSRRLLLQVAAAQAAALGVLAACGGSTGTTPTAVSTPATPATATIASTAATSSAAVSSATTVTGAVAAPSTPAAVSAAPTAPAGQALTLVFWSFFKTTSFAWKTQTQLLQAFNQSHPGLKADLQNTTYDVTAFATAVAAGTPPNVAVLDRYSVAAHAARALVQDISARANQAGIGGDQEQPWAWQEVNFQGKLFGLPDGTDSRAVYVNAGHLKQAGLPTTPPKTLQDFSDMVQHLTVKEGTG